MTQQRTDDSATEGQRSPWQRCGHCNCTEDSPMVKVNSPTVKVDSPTVKVESPTVKSDSPMVNLKIIITHIDKPYR
jgi:hypothetical protein